MASLTEQPYMFQQQPHEGDDYARYPDPPQAVYTSGPLDLSIPADAFVGGFQTSMAFEPSLFAEAPNNYYLSASSSNGQSSPGLYTDDSDLRLPSSSLSTTSVPSAASSPQSNPGHMGAVPEWGVPVNVQPAIVGNDYVDYHQGFPVHHGMEEPSFDFTHNKGFVDPSMIHPEISRSMPMPGYDAHFQHHHQQHPYPASPSVTSSPHPNVMRTHNSASPFLQHGPFQAAFATSPYAASMSHNPDAFISPTGGEYHSGDESGKEKQRCTYPDCGKVFKDLKAHMLTHQNERPEKCPIQTCEYHVKGFARKYDKNRHTLTHYKGTMVCGFCPGSGSAAEKSFNRADVFKRHLTAVHGVEQTPPNSRKRASNAMNGSKKLTGYAPDATGKCSTCSQTFSNAQDFYEHLDDCVLRIVQQEDPAEAINAQRLAEVENDKQVHQTLEKNNLPTTTQAAATAEDEEDFEMADEDDSDSMSKPSVSPMSKRKTNPPGGVQKSRGMTHSRGGVALATKTKGRKNRRDYPSSWGFDKGQMTMKKRVMAVFDGPRRLAKDDMMLSTDHEVRIKLSDGKAYVTDLDVQTLKRAEAFHNATDEEKGQWLSDDPTEEQLQEMQRMLETNSSL